MMQLRHVLIAPGVHGHVHVSFARSFLGVLVQTQTECAILRFNVLVVDFVMHPLMKRVDLV